MDGTARTRHNAELAMNRKMKWSLVSSTSKKGSIEAALSRQGANAKTEFRERKARNLVGIASGVVNHCNTLHDKLPQAVTKSDHGRRVTS